MNRPPKEKVYLDMAKALIQRSTCMRRQYACVIVNKDEIISAGYNGSPRGKPNCCDTGICHRLGHKHNDGDYSTCPAVHAEMNAIISAARKDMMGGTLYLYGEENGEPILDAEPCPVCRGLIEQAGLKVLTIKDLKNLQEE